MAWGSNLAEVLKNRFAPTDDYEDDDYYDDYEDDGYEEAPKKRGLGFAKISPFSRKAPTEPEYDSEVIGIKPTSIDDMDQVVDCLSQNKIVMLNTEECDEALAVRVLDFACGAVYALQGNFAQSAKRPGSSRGIYVITPENVNVSGAFESHLMG